MSDQHPTEPPPPLPTSPSSDPPIHQASSDSSQHLQRQHFDHQNTTQRLLQHCHPATEAHHGQPGSVASEMHFLHDLNTEPPHDVRDTDSETDSHTSKTQQQIAKSLALAFPTQFLCFALPPPSPTPPPYRSLYPPPPHSISPLYTPQFLSQARPAAPPPPFSPQPTTRTQIFHGVRYLFQLILVIPEWPSSAWYRTFQKLNTRSLTLHEPCFLSKKVGLRPRPKCGV